MTEPNYALEQAKAQYESICGMVAALEVDYDRLDELNNLENLCEDDRAELVRLREAADGCENQYAARDRIQEDPLTVQVRSGWATPGDALNVEEFEILLCTGGPAVRIVGELDEYGQPDRAWLEHQDWGTPWLRYFDVDEKVLLTYCREFYFGG